MKQVSIYAENKKGTMMDITGTLLEKDINILGSVTNDSAEYGIIRMVVSNPEIAYNALVEKGYICRLTEVIGVEIEDEAGTLHKLLQDLMNTNINVQYLYLSYNRETGKPIMVLSCPDVSEVRGSLKNRGYVAY